MSTTCIVGYCPELYDALQMVAHQELPYEPIDDWPPHARQYNEADRQGLIEKLLKALSNEGINDRLDKDLEHYLIVLLESITDDDLRQLILKGNLENLMINDHGFYLAEQR